MIKMYPIFKNLENWKKVLNELNGEQLKPTSDDYNLIMTQIEESSDKCAAAIRKQEAVEK